MFKCDLSPTLRSLHKSIGSPWATFEVIFHHLSSAQVLLRHNITYTSLFEFMSMSAFFWTQLPYIRRTITPIKVDWVLMGGGQAVMENGGIVVNTYTKNYNIVFIIFDIVVKGVPMPPVPLCINHIIGYLNTIWHKEINNKRPFIIAPVVQRKGKRKL